MVVLLYFSAFLAILFLSRSAKGKQRTLRRAKRSFSENQFTTCDFSTETLFVLQRTKKLMKENKEERLSEDKRKRKKIKKRKQKTGVILMVFGCI